MISFRSVKTFKGGAHPEEKKNLTENSPFELMPAPKQVLIPLSQHIGKPSRPVVKKGSEVKQGEIIAEADGFISSPVHSSVSGKVSKISVAGSISGFQKEVIIIDTVENDGTVLLPPLDVNGITPEQIRERVKEAGIVGQGGAAFPTFVKLTPPEKNKIDLVILNGCECEPYLTRDYRLMLERSGDLIEGLRLIMKALLVERAVIGIEDNKPAAIEKMRGAVKKIPGISVEVLKTKYPQGAEKMLIHAVTKREVPPGKLPLDVGVVIQNVGTALAVFDAVVKGEPQITAALTVSGLGINNPKNLIVKVGTPIREVLEFCGGMKKDAVKIIAGGPMMGVAQYDLSAPVMKATSGLLVLAGSELNSLGESVCLRCGKCVEVCPLNLLPTRLARFSQLGRFDDAERANIQACMECGTCTFNCPSGISLVQWIRYGKQKVTGIQKQRMAETVSSAN